MKCVQPTALRAVHKAPIRVKFRLMPFVLRDRKGAVLEALVQGAGLVVDDDALGLVIVRGGGVGDLGGGQVELGLA